MSSSVLHTVFGWMALSFAFGVVPLYAWIKSRAIFSHISHGGLSDEHVTRIDVLLKPPADADILHRATAFWRFGTKRGRAFGPL